MGNNFITPTHRVHLAFSLSKNVRFEMEIYDSLFQFHVSVILDFAFSLIKNFLVQQMVS